MDAKREVERLIKEYNCILVRKNKHAIYRLPSGASISLSVTPSDNYAHNQQLQELREKLGLMPVCGIPGERRKRKTKVGADRGIVITPSYAGTRTLQDELRKAVGE